MSQAKHTPGPWEVQPSSNPKNGTGWRDIVSTGCGPFSPAYIGEALEHDARLIAAAPDLLEALRNLLAEFDRYDAAMTKIGRGHEDYGCQRAEARAAIARATT